MNAGLCGKCISQGPKLGGSDCGPRGAAQNKTPLTQISTLPKHNFPRV